MKKLVFTLVLLTLTLFAFAQKGSIKGILIDSADRSRSVNYATVSIFKAGDSILTNYKLSDDKGQFNLPNLERGIDYRIVVTAWQYEVWRKDVRLSADQAELDLGKIFLAQSTNKLNEVVIKAERPPVLVRKDTIEFNAESFKTLPTAVVEDLLRKLPGVSVAADGNIQVNGKSVSRILVDGKEFFGGDQQMATKNLPSNIIDKVMINDDPEAKRRDPDLLAGNTPQVINLKLKKAIKQGAFGKLYAGKGQEELFETGGIMNFFRDTTQVSVLAYGNNVNKPGFSISDVSRIGGFSRSGINSVSINGDFFELNGVGFGGASSGVQRSAGAGTNFNTLTKNGIKINGKYFYGYGNNLLEQRITAEQNLGAEKLLSKSALNRENRSFSHNIGLRTEWKVDSLITLTFEPTVTLNQLRNEGLEQSEFRNTNNQLINVGVNNSRLKGSTTDYALFASLWKDSKKAGRSFNLSVNTNKRTNQNNNFNTAATSFYLPTPGSTLLDQLRDNGISNFNVYLSANYSEPISKKLGLRVLSNANYLDNENALFTFYHNPATNDYDIAVPNLSQTVIQTGYKANTRVSLRWKAGKDLTIQPGFVHNLISLENTFSSFPAFEQDFQFFAASLLINYKSYSFSYTPMFREPDVTYIQPIANNTNPLLVQLGNPNLRPSRSHQFNLNVYKYDTKRSLNYSLNGNGTLQNDAVILERTLDANGVQTNRPVNADGILRFHANGNVSKDIKNGKRQFTVGGGFFANYTRNIVSVNSRRSYMQSYQASPRLNARINLNDKLELGESYNIAYNKTTYNDSFYNDIRFFTHSSDTEFILRLPKKMVWETNYRIQYSTQRVAGFSNNFQLWNAALTLLFMKNDRAQLKFAVNDILNTNTRRYLTITENSIRNQQFNNLGRHGLVTFTYNIQNFGGKVGGRETMFRF